MRRGDMHEHISSFFRIFTIASCYPLNLPYLCECIRTLSKEISNEKILALHLHYTIVCIML